MENAPLITIKGMVCNRCIETIEHTLLYAGYQVTEIRLGKVWFGQQIEQDHRLHLRETLKKLGFELLSDRNESLLSEIKEAICGWIELMGHGEKPLRLSDYLVSRFDKSYDSLSVFFSGLEGMTIEKYYIGKRIEKVKEFLVYTNLSLSEIAYRTGFSSPHHLSSQFKKITGQNPTDIRQKPVTQA